MNGKGSILADGREESLSAGELRKAAS